MAKKGLCDKLVEILGAEFAVTELSAGEYAACKAGPMKFKISHYDVAGLGHLSVMSGSAMLGLMKMDTFILAPTSKDMPLFSYDRIKAMGNDTLILEYYDTLVDESLRAAQDEALSDGGELCSVPDHDLGEHWYDGLKYKSSISKRCKGMSDRLDSYVESCFTKFLSLSMDSPDVDESEKKLKTKQYVDGLFANGGPSTDAFVKAIGADAARALFESIIFATK